MASVETTGDCFIFLLDGGFCWSQKSNPTINDNKISCFAGCANLTGTLSSLTEGLTYYVRAYAKNSNGIAYSKEVSFEPSANNGIIQDINGNTYKTVVIGSQTWMMENLRATKLNDGTPIQMITDKDIWIKSTSPAFCFYNNDYLNYGQIYGALYNMKAVLTKKLAPQGWHVATSYDWGILDNLLCSNSGGKMRYPEIGYWEAPNDFATNESGFSGLPGGCRLDGEFKWIGIDTFWWADDNSIPLTVRGLNEGSELIGGLLTCNISISGMSVRCVKD